MSLHIKGFRLDTRKNNVTHYGHLFYRYVKLPFASKKYKTRVIRIWVVYQSIDSLS